MSATLKHFRLLRGTHTDGRRIYKRNEVIETPTDLAKRFNQRGSVKFQRLSAEEAAASPPSLESMTVAELRVIAEQEGCELEGNVRKADLIEAIEEARQLQTAD